MRSLKLLTIVLSIFITACSVNTHIGKIKTGEEKAVFSSTTTGDDYATFLCASGSTQYIFPFQWSTPRVTLITEDGPIHPFFGAKKHKAVKLASGNRNFSLNFKFSDTYANIKVKDFNVMKGETYLVKYFTDGDKFIPWIETKDGNVVYGKKQESPKS